MGWREVVQIGMTVPKLEPASRPLRPVCAELRCNRIQPDAIRDRANQPGFLFYDVRKSGL